jgi:hypothetical protein
MQGFLLLEAIEAARRHFGTAFIDKTIYTTPVHTETGQVDTKKHADFSYRQETANFYNHTLHPLL